MSLWQQFFVVAGAHFLALLSPGPDFFLILRTALGRGWQRAVPVCTGIALANGLFILLALSGVALLRENGVLFSLLKWAGCGYLAWLGWLFVSHREKLTLPEADQQSSQPAQTASEFVRGFLSGILTPKNSLFYASLFTLAIRPETPASIQAAYGLWMFLAVLLWDLSIAGAIGHPAVVRRFIRHVRTMERITGVVLLSIAAGVAMK